MVGAAPSPSSRGKDSLPSPILGSIRGAEAGHIDGSHMVPWWLGTGSIACPQGQCPSECGLLGGADPGVSYLLSLGLGWGSVLIGRSVGVLAFGVLGQEVGVRGQPRPGSRGGRWGSPELWMGLGPVPKVLWISFCLPDCPARVGARIVNSGLPSPLQPSSPGSSFLPRRSHRGCWPMPMPMLMPIAPALVPNSALRWGLPPSLWPGWWPWLLTSSGPESGGRMDLSPEPVVWES